MAQQPGGSVDQERAEIVVEGAPEMALARTAAGYSEHEPGLDPQVDPEAQLEAGFGRAPVKSVEVVATEQVARSRTEWVRTELEGGIPPQGRDAPAAVLEVAREVQYIHQVMAAVVVGLVDTEVVALADSVRESGVVVASSSAGAAAAEVAAGTQPDHWSRTTKGKPGAVHHRNVGTVAGALEKHNWPNVLPQTAGIGVERPSAGGRKHLGTIHIPEKGYSQLLDESVNQTVAPEPLCIRRGQLSRKYGSVISGACENIDECDYRQGCVSLDFPP
jgi:hypothetical protein